MIEDDNPIALDQPEKPRPKPDLLLLGIGSLALLATAILLKFFHWPYYFLVAAAGFTGMSLRYLILFFRDPQLVSDWLYFGGRMLLLAGVASVFFMKNYTAWVFLPAAIFFLLGIFLSKKESADK
ncbi:MAG: hypothetical protein IT223_08330 [Crocinitomicaceae bacterium]|nr:hypothetical protein [Crocinitomicaceae bacterium]